MTGERLTLYHAPNTRSFGVLVLLEELGASFDLHVLNIGAGEQRQQAYLSINPMGKVPAVMHGSSLITEQAAIYIYLADLFPKAGLAPALHDPLRGPYLRWMVYYAACFEPAIVDRALKRDPGPPGTVPYGDYDATIGTLMRQIEQGPYMLGDRFTAADILWGSALNWTSAFKLVPDTPAMRAYIQRFRDRPSVGHATARDAGIAQAQAAVATP